MFRIAVQIKELVSSNVTSALDSASNPAKMLNRLQREIEEAIITLSGESTKAGRRLDALDAELRQAKLREADWSDKAQLAMDGGREDLARQALTARNDCRSAIERLREDISRTKAEIAEMKQAIADLEAKREETQVRLRDQLAADCNAASANGGASRTERRMDHIADLEKRTEFATEESATAHSNAALDREIDAMRREREIDADLAALRSKSEAKAAKKPAKPPRKAN